VRRRLRAYHTARRRRKRMRRRQTLAGVDARMPSIAGNLLAYR
jgi:hypothetical protein